MTEDEIRKVVQNLATAVNLLSSTITADRRRAHEAAQLNILYDHKNGRAQLSVAPWFSDSAGGGT
jgi:hypothetical protein